MRAEAKPGDGRWMRLLPFILVVPSLALVLVLFVYPLLRLVVDSFLDPSPGIGNYVEVVTDPTLWQIIETTLIISAQCTVATLLLAYPVSYLLSRLPRSRANLLMMFVLLPFWTSLLVRMYAWMVLLGRHGIINEALTSFGVINKPYPLLYNRFAVIVGMSHFLLPFMVLSLYSTMIGIDRSLIEAASSMGSSFRQTFLRIYLPLSLPGIYAGCLLVFILAMGFYITPALLGSPQETTISVYIQQQIQQLNWGEGTAMAVILVAIVVGLFTVYDRLLGFDRLFRDVGAR
jgi:putative spermidine/putrescine transport system permease protein